MKLMMFLDLKIETTWKMIKEIQNTKFLLLFFFSKLKMQATNEISIFFFKKKRCENAPKTNDTNLNAYKEKTCSFYFFS